VAPPPLVPAAAAAEPAPPASLAVARGHAPAAVAAATPATAAPAVPPPEAPAAAPRTLGEAEIEMIKAALAAADGNISEASKRLGISRNTIYRKLRWAKPA